MALSFSDLSFYCFVTTPDETITSPIFNVDLDASFVPFLFLVSLPILVTSFAMALHDDLKNAEDGHFIATQNVQNDDRIRLEQGKLALDVRGEILEDLTAVRERNRQPKPNLKYKSLTHIRLHSGKDGKAAALLSEWGVKKLYDVLENEVDAIEYEFTDHELESLVKKMQEAETGGFNPKLLRNFYKDFAAEHVAELKEIHDSVRILESPVKSYKATRKIRINFLEAGLPITIAVFTFVAFAFFGEHIGFASTDNNQNLTVNTEAKSPDE